MSGNLLETLTNTLWSCVNHPQTVCKFLHLNESSKIHRVCQECIENFNIPVNELLFIYSDSESVTSILED